MKIPSLFSSIRSKFLRIQSSSALGGVGCQQATSQTAVCSSISRISKLLNKTSQSHGSISWEAGLWIMRIIILSLVFASTPYLASLYIKTTQDTSVLRANLFVHTLVNSPHCLAEFDLNTGVTQILMIDTDKLSDDLLNTCIQWGDENGVIAAKISAYDQGGNLFVESYYGKTEYDRWRPLSFSGKYYFETKTFLVRYKLSQNPPTKQHSPLYGILKVEVMTPR